METLSFPGENSTTVDQIGKTVQEDINLAAARPPLKKPILTAWSNSNIPFFLVSLSPGPCLSSSGAHRRQCSRAGRCLVMSHEDASGTIMHCIPARNKPCVSSARADAKVEIITSDVDIKIGNEQLLLCKAGKEADITWQKDGEDIDEDRHLVEKVDETSSKLHLKNVDLKDSGTYKCLCEYENHNDNSDIKIFVYEEPNFGETKTYHEFLENLTVHVPCVATGKPDVEISWFRDDVLVSNDGKNHLTVLPDRNLQIANIRKSDYGTYTCQASIKDRPTIYKRLDISVVVNVPPTVRVRSERTNVHAGPDTNVTIICLVAGVPKPIISWTTPPTSDSSRYIYNSDKSELIIPAVARSDFGEYVCTAANKLGDDSAAFILDVSERPYVILSKEEMAVKPGESVSVSCNATGHPSPSIEWSSNEGKKIEGPELHIENVKPSDGGVYSCKAENPAGSTTNTFQLITSPSVPQYFTVTPGPISANINLHAPVKDGGSPITNIVIQWKKQAQDQWTETAIPLSDHMAVTSLAPYTWYIVRFAAQNKHFIGGFSEEKKIRTKGRREPDSPLLSATDGKIEGNSYSIPFKLTEDGGYPIQRYVVRYRMDKEGENWKEKEIAANMTMIQLQNLQYNSDYQMEVFALNINGSSFPAALNFTIPQAVNKPSLGKGGVAGIVIVIFLVLLVAVDAFCCYTNHCGLLNFLARKLFGHKASDTKIVEEGGVINNAAVDMNGLEKPRGSIPKLQAQKGATNGVHSEVTCDKAPLTKFDSPNCHLQKFSDDSAIVGLISNEEDTEYRELIQDFVDWCLQNHLQINAGKTKELVVDFRRCRHPPPPLVNIWGMDTERVDSQVPGCSPKQQTGLVSQHHCTSQKGPEQTLPTEETEVIWSAGSTPEDLLRYSGGICHLLRSGLLGQQHLDGRQEETGQAVKEGRLCPGKPLRPSAG
ncbi:hypothetical protein NFI96_020825, partial [Prochilodus magdalenae]